jgi:hypothetical protein
MDPVFSVLPSLHQRLHLGMGLMRNLLVGYSFTKTITITIALFK